MLLYFLAEKARARGISFNPPRTGDAGIDICACIDVVLSPGQQGVIETGLYLAIPLGWVGLIRDRSSMAARLLYTHGGVIDAAYRGEVKVLLRNHSTEAVKISIGERIAQMVIVPHLQEIQEAQTLESLGETARGNSGFGSTGK